MPGIVVPVSLMMRLARAQPHSRLAGIATGLALLGVLLLALSFRLARVADSHPADAKHFYDFAGVLFTRDHFNYYADVADQNFTYAHLPLFPYLLAPVLRLVRYLGRPDVYAVKAIVYSADLAAGVLLYLIARGNGLGRASSIAVMAMWLFSPWVITASANEGHSTSVAAFFALLALLRARVGWQAGTLWALAVATRTEFVFPAAAATVYYAIHRRPQFLAFISGSAGVFALVVLPYAIRDLRALWWAVFGHLQGRGDGLPSLRGLFNLFGQAYPRVLEGPFDWALRAGTLAALVAAAFESDLRRSVLKLGIVYALTLVVVHARYLVMPQALALSYASRPALIGILVAWYAAENAGVLGDALWLIWVAALAALYLAPFGEGALRRLRSVPAEASSIPTAGAG